MAYTPTEWKSGDVITAEKLNKLEEGVQEASGEEWVVAFNGSITTASSGNVTMSSFVPTTSIEGDSVLVTFENVTYELPKVVLSFGTGGTGWGEFDSGNNPILTNYPCAIGISGGTSYFFTSEAGTYEVEIKILQNSSDSSVFIVTFSGDVNHIVADKTLEEITQAYLSGLLIVFRRLVTSSYGSTFDRYYYGIANAYVMDGSPSTFWSNIIADIHFSNDKITSIEYKRLEINFNGPIITETTQNFNN